MKRFIILFVNILFTILFISHISLAIEPPEWLKNLEDFAKKHNDKELMEKVKLYSSEEALKLQKDWRDFLGYDAYSIIKEKSKLYPDIKPGVVITPDNYKQFPSLKKLLPESLYLRLEKGAYGEIPQIRVIPTSQYYHYREILEATKRGVGKPRVGPNSELLNWVAGIPFPFPKTAAEVFHDRDRVDAAGDVLMLNNASYTMFNRKQKLERIERGNTFWLYVKGRTKLPPKPEIPGMEDVLEKSSLIMTYPFDLKGLATLRVKFVDKLKKPDEFMSYIPALRRTRKLAGTDTMDPIVGTDISWEDWRGWWQNLITWPTDFKLIGEGEVLVPSLVHKLRYQKVEKGKLYTNWEIRPCWILEGRTRSKLYFYSKRRIWVDKEYFMSVHYEMYDVRGNLWKSLLPIRYHYPNGVLSWNFADVIDYVNRHRTVMRFNMIVDDPNITLDYFDLKFLIRKAH
jgi:hypothetical protein